MSLSLFQPWLDRWGLRPDGAVIVGGYTGNCLLPVIRDGAPAMLKIAHHEDERRGAAVMAWYAGKGAATVLAYEGEALLLERVIGAESLVEMAAGGRDDEATGILCAAAAGLHAPRDNPAPSSLVPLTTWFERLPRRAASDGGMFLAASRIARRLLDEPHEVVVLHGDFHHANVLDGGARGWLAIDPKGLIGERGFEYANIFCNPGAAIALSPGRIRRQTSLIAAHANLEPRKLLEWLAAYAGLAAAGCIDDGFDPGPALAIAEIAAGELAL
jgi:streptomycin 6-kinase